MYVSLDPCLTLHVLELYKTKTLWTSNKPLYSHPQTRIIVSHILSVLLQVYYTKNKVQNVFNHPSPLTDSPLPQYLPQWHTLSVHFLTSMRKCLLPWHVVVPWQSSTSQGPVRPPVANRPTTPTTPPVDPRRSKSPLSCVRTPHLYPTSSVSVNNFVE